MDLLLALAQDAVRSDHIMLFINELLIFAVIWSRVKPVILKVVSDLKAEMAVQMSAMREEVRGVRVEVATLSKNMTEIEHSHQKRISLLEDSVVEIKQDIKEIKTPKEG